jgi:hypothetical protein
MTVVPQCFACLIAGLISVDSLKSQLLDGKEKRSPIL